MISAVPAIQILQISPSPSPALAPSCVTCALCFLRGIDPGVLRTCADYLLSTLAPKSTSPLLPPLADRAVAARSDRRWE